MLCVLNFGLSIATGDLLSLIIWNTQIKRSSSYVILCAEIIFLGQERRSAYLAKIKDESKISMEFSTSIFKLLHISNESMEKLFWFCKKEEKLKFYVWLHGKDYKNGF